MRTLLVATALAAFMVAYLAMGWIAGLVLLAIASLSLVHRLLQTRQALAPSIRCPWCGEDVPQYGAFSCGHCRARTVGWAWRCSLCGEWAGHLECESCHMSVPNPLVGRS
jgi:hypothetical protein